MTKDLKFYFGEDDDIENFVLTTDGEWDNIVEVYSVDHDLCAKLHDGGLGHTIAEWPYVHGTMRIIPCLGYDASKFFLVVEGIYNSTICCID